MPDLIRHPQWRANFLALSEYQGCAGAASGPGLCGMRRFLRFLRLACLQGAHSAQVQRQAHELELSLHAV
jgi:hypothetical protein